MDRDNRQAGDRQFTTFLKVKLPEISGPTQHAADNQVVEFFSQLLEILQTTDDSLVLYPYRENTNMPTKSAPFIISSRNTVSKYVDRLFVAFRKHSWIRVKIGHDQQRHVFESEDFIHNCAQQNIVAYPDLIQDSDVTCVGWFLGAVTKAFNAKEFVPALNLHPLLEGIELEIRIQEFRSLPRERWHTTVKVPHLFCAGRHFTTVKRALHIIYGSQREGGLPQGKDYKFIPYTADPHRRPSPMLLTKTRKAAVLQRQYEDKPAMCYSSSITLLDYHIGDEAIGTTLRELAMCIKSTDGRNFFVSVDTMWNGDVAFSFLKKLSKRKQNTLLTSLI